MEKHKATDKELKEMLTLYLKGVKPRNILKRFPEVDITAKDLSTWFSKQRAKENKDKINDKVMENLVNDIIDEETEANRQLLAVTSQIVGVIKEYLDKGQYMDFAGFNYGKMVKTRSNTLNTFAFNQVVKALSEAQKVQRLALGCDDKNKDNENMPAPVINIDFGDSNGD